MKKLAIAAACAALSSTAFAQSSVTAYALIDLNLTQYSSGGVANAGTLRVMNDGTTNGLNGSRLGFRGTEDLGGGLRAGFNIEQGLAADTGALLQGGRGWGRQAFVFLSSASAGEVRLGRQYILSDYVLFQGDPFGNALVNNPTTSVTNMGRNLPLFLNAPRADNVVQFQTAVLGGLQLAAQVAPGEGVFDRFHGFRAMYTGGQFFAAASYEFGKNRSTGAMGNKSLSASVNYNFGFFKFEAALQRNTDLATGSGNGAAVGVSNLVLSTNASGAASFTIKDINGLTVGGEIPLGNNFALGVNYVKMDYKGTNGATSDLGKLALSGRYALSKNTFLYAGGYQATGALKDYISQNRVLQAGVRTAF